MTRLRILLAILFAVALAGLAIHWSPSRQVRLHQDSLQRAVEKRNWNRVGEFLAADYKDRWGQDRTLALQHLPQAFQDFLAIGILGDEIAVSRNGDQSVVRTRLKIVGSGGPLAQFVMDRMDSLKEPFAFTWRKESWKPWDWTLVQIDQPEIEIPEFDYE